MIRRDPHVQHAPVPAFRGFAALFAGKLCFSERRPNDDGGSAAVRVCEADAIPLAPRAARRNAG